METFDKKNHILETKSLRDIVADLKKGESWLMLAAIAAFLASAFFVVKYFVGGDMNPALWTGEQWLNAALGLGITAVITAAQAMLYASGYKGNAALVATGIVVFFGLFSEISQSMEREDATVRHRSENSPVFQAALGNIENAKAAAVAPIACPYADALAKAEIRLAQCQSRVAAGKEPHCKGDSARVSSLKEQCTTALSATSATVTANLTAAVQQAKELEYDEDKHYAMIRLIRDLFDVAGIWASFLFSLIVIGTFEYAFHFVGGYVADHRAALRAVGRDKNGNPITVAADTVGAATAPQSETVNNSTETATAPQSETVNDLSRERFFRLIYTEVRALILNGEISPTVSGISGAITEIIDHHTRSLGLNPSNLSTADSEKMAKAILAKLEKEGVVTVSNGNYSRAARWDTNRPAPSIPQTYRSELSNGGTTIRDQPLDSNVPRASASASHPAPTGSANGNAALKMEQSHPAPAHESVPVQLHTVPTASGAVDTDLLYRKYRSAVLAKTVKPTVRPSRDWLKANGVGGRNEDREAVAGQYINRLLDDGIIRHAGRAAGDPRGPYELIGA